jgi:hypothetical protein
MYERSVVAAVLTNGLLDAVQPGTDAQVAAKRVATTALRDRRAS